MTNSSATRGYLAPFDFAPPTDDDDLTDQLVDLVAGITGLADTLVRPSWQPIPPKQPEHDVDWCAVGVTGIDQDANAAILHRPGGEGYDELHRHETISALASFYGPHASTNAARFRDGLSIAQNRDAMRCQGLAYYDIGAAVTLPTLMNNIWVRRVDLPFRVRRQVTRYYPILNVLSVESMI